MLAPDGFVKAKLASAIVSISLRIFMLLSFKSGMPAIE
jgi:hypothetical protein